MAHTFLAGDIYLKDNRNHIVNMKLDHPTDTMKIHGYVSTTEETPTNSEHLTSKAYVDALVAAAVQGISWKNSVRCTTTANVDLTDSTPGNGVGAVTGVDLLTVADGDRVLLKDQTSGIENGIWIANSLLTLWVRSDDMASGETARGAGMWVNEGTTLADKGYVCTNDKSSDVVGTNSLTFVNFTGGSTVAGADTQIQYNNSGSFGASSNLIFDGTGLGINNIINNGSGDMKIENTNSVGEIQMKLGSASYVNSKFVVKDSSNNERLIVGGNGSFQIPTDGAVMSYSSIDALQVSHGGAAGNGLIYNDVGDLTIENDAVTKNVIAKLGSNTTNEKFIVQDSSASTLFSVDGAGDTNIKGALTLTGDLIESSNGNLSIKNTVGGQDISLDLAAGVGDVKVKLGNELSTSKFIVNDSADVEQFSVDANGETNVSVLTVGSYIDMNSSYITNPSGNLLINQGAANQDLQLSLAAGTGDITNKLGNTSTSKFLVKDSANVEQFSVQGDGELNIAGDTVNLNYNSGPTTITNTGTGRNLFLETTGTGQVINKLGNTTTSQFKVTDSADVKLMGCTAAGDVTLGRNDMVSYNNTDEIFYVGNNATGTGDRGVFTIRTHSDNVSGSTMRWTDETSPVLAYMNYPNNTHTFNLVNSDSTGDLNFQMGSNTSATKFTIQNLSASNLFEIDGAGACTINNLGTGTVSASSGTLSTTSDERLKNIYDKPVTYGLAEILKIKPIFFKFKSQEEQEQVILGFSAQNIQKVIPESVCPNPQGFLGLDNKGIIAALVGAVKELNEKIDRQGKLIKTIRR